jgi:RHS repeat-associated protein
VLDANFALDADGLSDVKNVYLYTGREYDWDVGLQISSTRYYAAHLGRWLTRDRFGYAAGDANLYGYVGAMPTYYVDPWGLEEEEEDGGGWWDWMTPGPITRPRPPGPSIMDKPSGDGPPPPDAIRGQESGQ